jgi:hypothetical protein
MLNMLQQYFVWYGDLGQSGCWCCVSTSQFSSFLVGSLPRLPVIPHKSVHLLASPLQPWRCRQYVSPKRLNLPVSVHGITIRKNDIVTMTVIRCFMQVLYSLCILRSTSSARGLTAFQVLGFLPLGCCSPAVEYVLASTRNWVNSRQILRSEVNPHRALEYLSKQLRNKCVVRQHWQPTDLILRRNTVTFWFPGDRKLSFMDRWLRRYCLQPWLEKITTYVTPVTWFISSYHMTSLFSRDRANTKDELLC